MLQAVEEVRSKPKIGMALRVHAEDECEGNILIRLCAAQMGVKVRLCEKDKRQIIHHRIAQVENEIPMMFSTKTTYNNEHRCVVLGTQFRICVGSILRAKWERNMRTRWDRCQATLIQVWAVLRKTVTHAVLRTQYHINVPDSLRSTENTKWGTCYERGTKSM